MPVLHDYLWLDRWCSYWFDFPALRKQVIWEKYLIDSSIFSGSLKECWSELGSSLKALGLALGEIFWWLVNICGILKSLTQVVLWKKNNCAVKFHDSEGSYFYDTAHFSFIAIFVSFLIIIITMLNTLKISTHLKLTREWNPESIRYQRVSSFSDWRVEKHDPN